MIKSVYGDLFSMSDMSSLLSMAGAVVTLGTAFLTIHRINRTVKKDREEQKAEILQQAKEEDALIKAKLEARIESLKAELKSLQLSVNKDIEHLKETHSGQIANLGEKIEQLRDELRSQHSQMVELLGKLIDNR